MKKYNVKEIMSRAWSIRRNAAAEIGCNVSDVVMSECLRMAWAEAIAVAAVPVVVSTWAAMTGEQQRDFIAKNVRKASKNEIRYSIEDRYLQFAEVPAFGCHRPHDYDEFISEAYIRVCHSIQPDVLTACNLRRASKGKPPMTLVSIIYNAARASIAAIAYGDAKHSIACNWTITDDDGDTADYLETMCGDIHQDTARSAIIRADMGRFTDSLDDIGRQITAMLLDGKTEREIGEAVGISSVAVHKRIIKMRQALAYLKDA